MRIIYLLLLFFASLAVSAQDSIQLTFDSYYSQVVQYHPIIKQARLLPQQAKMELRSARGAFDPVASVDYRNKTTNEKNSYTYFTPEVKIPTRIGVDIKGGYEQSSGSSINPEVGKFDPETGQYANYGLLYGGLSVPIGQGLLFDRRRAALQQAFVLQNLAQAEQVKIINKLLLETAKVYWEWQQSFELLILMQANVRVAQDRLSFINNRIRLGEEKPIDSVEAYIEFARREVLLIEAELDFKNAGIILSNHLWNENNEPLALKENTFPQTYSLTIEKISNDSLQRLLNNAKDNHPEIMAMSAKIRSIDIERKLSAELIKPQLNLEYYPFQTFTYGNRDEVNNVLTNNYKFGATFYMPILLRKERGKLEATKFKLKQSQLEFDQNQRTIINNIFTSYNEVLNLSNLVGIQNDLVINAVLLRDAEEIRFESGESSLFLVNMRERSLIESQAKLVELRAKFAKSLANLQWSAGSRLAN